MPTVAKQIDIYAHERAGLCERLEALNGGTTWREPAGGFGAGMRPDTVPRSHTLAMALAFARDHSGPSKDVGPDVLESMVFRRVINQDQILTAMVHALAEMPKLAYVERSVLRQAARAILIECVTGREAKRPSAVKWAHWVKASEFGIRLLWASAGATISAANDALR